jgi:glycosyltransferase involved in cell wall biosynthesis
MFIGSLRTAHRLHREMKFDCIDAHFVYPDGLAAVLLGKFLKLPVVVSARGTDINLYPSFRSIRPQIRWAIKHSSGVIAVSTSLLEPMLGLGARPAHSRVIGNGIDLDRFSPIAPAQARNHLGLPGLGMIIVSVGALTPRKGFHFLIPALAQIAPRFPAIHLYILGEGEYRSMLEALIRECKLENQVTLVGKIPNEQLRYWFSAASISCLVSSREGWANVLPESLACGTPVVATRVWGAPEIIVSPELGLLVEQDVQSIAAGLESALIKDWDRQYIAQQAAKRTWQIVAAEVEEFLFSIISGANSQQSQSQFHRS